jgi:5'-3' exonuclease
MELNLTKKDSLLNYSDTPYKPRVFLIDYSVYVHRGIFAWRNVKGAIPATFYTINSICSCLKQLKPRREDLIILAIDSYGKGNWRKDYDPAYKANRKESRDKCDDIDWPKQFRDMNALLDNINLSTQFIPIQIDRLEADDIISYCCRYFTDRDITILTTDSDMNQLYELGNVKIFSPITKKIREVKNPLGELAKKIQEEATDNLVSPITNKLEYDKRKTIVSLLSLPKEIDEVLHSVIKDIKQKEVYYPEHMKFQGIKKKYNDIFIN